MKKNILSVIAIFVMFIISSCGGNVEKNIIGKWKVKSVEVSNLEELKKQLIKDFGITKDKVDVFATELLQDMFKKLYEKNIEFLSNNVLKGFDGEGTWEYDAENETIKLTEDTGVHHGKINELSSENLSLTIDFEDSGMKFVFLIDFERI